MPPLRGLEYSNFFEEAQKLGEEKLGKEDIEAAGGVNASELDRDLVQGDDELNALHLLSLQAPVVCNEEVNLSAGGARQLNGVGCAYGAIEANLGILPCGFGVE